MEESTCTAEEGCRPLLLQSAANGWIIAKTAATGGEGGGGGDATTAGSGSAPAGADREMAGYQQPRPSLGRSSPQWFRIGRRGSSIVASPTSANTDTPMQDAQTGGAKSEEVVEDSLASNSSGEGGNSAGGLDLSDSDGPERVGGDTLVDVIMETERRDRGGLPASESGSPISPSRPLRPLTLRLSRQQQHCRALSEETKWIRDVAAAATEETKKLKRVRAECKASSGGLAAGSAASSGGLAELSAASSRVLAEGSAASSRGLAEGSAPFCQGDDSDRGGKEVSRRTNAFGRAETTMSQVITPLLPVVLVAGPIGQRRG
uniref:Uncharacterized protein n=1 Tax=Chromera velia CCMP2878 TaxID=1169474 RepID=A0A0G4HW71_9ALVE|eukprot:Cvel_32486.t1-p1 / transcript=Cvel_32486.t1 / gene=Cvel_32486 / organism=Chromera_velia_CCMP2878 / gene_product=hypothetical protein / transcript_product=hypothetical protein / location=Cvel_scaffold5064:1961-6048(-) / protein_length=318 / sequence_SO=supercontig / SO=protein_coding / is_pseudo=false